MNLGVKLISLPWSSVAREISSEANIVTMADHKVASAVNRPDYRMSWLVTGSVALKQLNPTWTYTPTQAESVLCRVIIRQRTVDVDEPLWHKTRWVGVPVFIP